MIKIWFLGAYNTWEEGVLKHTTQELVNLDIILLSLATSICIASNDNQYVFDY